MLIIVALQEEDINQYDKIIVSVHVGTYGKCSRNTANLRKAH